MPIARSILLLLALLSLGAVVTFTQVPADLQQAIRERQRAIDSADAAVGDRLTAEGFTLADAMTKALVSHRLSMLQLPPADDGILRRAHHLVVLWHHHSDVLQRT